MSSTENPADISAPASERSLLWQPARWFLSFFWGVLFAAVFSFFLNETDTGEFATFLRGQTGFEALGMAWLWKVATGFVIGALGGFYFYLEVPKSYRKKANDMALVMSLFLIPLLTYIPAMSAGFIWDDDQEISMNPSIVLQYSPHERAYHTNWKGLWEIWTGGITNQRETDEGRAELGKGPAPWLVKTLRPPLCAIEQEIFGGADKANYLFQGNQFADYFPVKSTTLWIEYQLWGYHIDPQGRAITDGPPFHIMTIIFHAIDCVLLWGVLRQLKVPGAWLGALLFGIHPVHSESVAWIAERKNTLSLLFVLLSLRYWLKYDESGNRRQYLASLGLFMTALLCKTHVVVFPAVLVLMEWWRKGTVPVAEPLYRLLRGRDANAKKVLVHDLWRYVPFFVITGLLSEMTIWFQNDRAIGGEVIPIGDFASRLAGASVVIWSYLSKALLPIDLNTIYANTGWLWWPLTDPQPWQYLMGVLVLVTLLVLFYVGRVFQFRTERAARTPFFVFAYFVGTLVPVLGFLTMSYMRLTLQADHFQYFSDISIVAAAGALVAIAYERIGSAYRPALGAACVLAIGAACMYSWERAGVHQGEETLWRACLKRNEASWQAHNHIGAVLYSQRKIAEAAPHFERAVELKPENPEVHNNLGLVRWYYGRFDEAIAQYREAVRIKGEVIALRRNLADAYVTLKRYNEALQEYSTMIKDVPNDSNLRSMKGLILAETGRYIEAKQEFEKALEIDPNNPMPRKNLEILRQKGI